MPPFRLEQVLQHRKHLEDVAQKDLSQAQRSLQEETAHLQSLEARHRQLSEDMRRETDTMRSASLCSLYHEYMHHVKGDMARQTDRVRTQFGLVEEKRLRLVEAVKQRKTIERLKQHYMQRQWLETERQHQQFADDAGIAAYNRRRH